jgi:dihydrofolate synthase/folylpolyglutamate synthase
MDYEEALEWLYNIRRFGPDRTLVPTRHIFHLMGNPQEKYHKIHIGGTSGKGSTSAYTASILEAAGYKVGLYTSPHLEQFTERVKINGKEIPSEEVARIMTEIKPLFGEMLLYEEPMPLRFFDIVTAMAFQYFAEQKVDLAVLEVGLGGRLDATNIVDPLVSVITNIGYEHTNILGETLEEIAWEKAGIIKPGRPIVTATQNPSVLNVFLEKTNQVGTKLYHVGEDTKFEKQKGGIRGQHFNYHGLLDRYENLYTPILGDHQLINASTAITTVEALQTYKIKISEEAIRRGIREVYWPARLEIVLEEPLVVLDCAKDAEATKAVHNTIKNDFNSKKIIAVVSISSDKNISGMVYHISQLARHFILTTHSIKRRAADPELLAEEVTKNHKTYEILKEEEKAFQRALDLARKDEMVLVIGSVYLAGTARTFFKKLARNANIPLN